MISEEMKTTIKTLYEKGYNKSQIARMLDIDRKTVRAKLRPEKEPNTKEKKPTIIEPYKEYIKIEAEKGIQAKRIYDDIAAFQGYKGSYDSVKKYVHELKHKAPKPFMVLNTHPGEEAQVDFGYVGTLKVGNKYRKAWVFAMSLSYSRYMYADLVLDQKVETFIECHKRAFRYFGGIPESVKIDNLKAAVLEANFYEPSMQKDYAAFASHYGYLANLCRVYTPTDKGKIESNVKYIKNNCFKGRAFKDFQEARDFLAFWLDNTANKRKHGTTKLIPEEVFNDIEAERLSPLPENDYILSKSMDCLVATNCHITYRSNYYSVPYGYIGRTVKAVEINGFLHIYDEDKEIALHSMQTGEKGKFHTDIHHYPHSKNITIADILSRQRQEMASIGDAALDFFERYLNVDLKNRKYDYRAISGILALRKKYSSEAINAACERSLHFNAISYKMVKSILEKDIDTSNIPSSSYISDTASSLMRSLEEYNKFLSKGGAVK